MLSRQRESNRENPARDRPTTLKQQETANSYRPDIDGLRAVAVAAVILNHLDHRLMQGGYLGVDVFFVISGFVITRSLRRAETDHLGTLLADFFARRCRRLVPALALCATLSGLAAWAIDPSPAVSLNTGLTALAGMSNLFLLWTAQDYFAPATALNLFTQTWSLGVEEQFYILFPLLVWASGLSRGTARFFILCLGVSFLSLLAMMLLPGKTGGAAYFLMFGRLWELGCGCMAALAGPKLTRHRPAIAWLSIGSMLAVMAAPFPPNVLSALLIVPPSVSLILSGGTAMLAWPPISGLGRMSYSLYLWHWPVVSAGLLLFGSDRWDLLTRLPLILLLGAASYRLVERPARARLAMLPNRWSFAVAVLAVAIAGGLLLGLKHWPNPHALAPRQFTAMPADFPLYPGTHVDHVRECVVDGSLHPARPTTFERCTLAPRPGARNTIWAMGDSHAGHLRGLLVALHEQAGAGIHLIETPGVTFPLPPGIRFPERDAFFAMTQPRLRPGDIVLLGRLFVSRETAFQPLPDIDAWLSAVVALSVQLRPLGVHVVMAGPPPRFRFASIYGCAPGQNRVSGCDIDRVELASAIDPIEATLRKAANQHPNLHMFSQFAVLCPPEVTACSPIRDGISQFRDLDHLNSAGSASLAPAFLQAQEAWGLPGAAGKR